MRNNIKIIHKKCNATYLGVAFFNSFASLDDLHLLEHVMMNPDRVLLNKKKSKDSYMYEFLNAKITGMFLSVFGRAIHQDALELANLMYYVCRTPITSYDVDAFAQGERSMIEKEHELIISGSSGSAIFDLGIQCYSPSLNNDESVDLDLVGLHKKLVEGAIPCVVVIGDTSNIYVQSAIEVLKSLIDSFADANKGYRLDRFFDHSYSFQRNLYPKVLSQKNRRIALYVGLAATDFLHIKKYRYAHLFFLWGFVGKILEDYIRLEIKSDYAVDSIYRGRFFGFEFFFEFFCGVVVQDIVNILQREDYVNEENFDKIKEFFIKKVILYSEEDPGEIAYALFVSFVFDGSFKTHSQLIHEIKSIEYEDFLIIYDIAMKNLCVYLIND